MLAWKAIYGDLARGVSHQPADSIVGLALGRSPLVVAQRPVRDVADSVRRRPWACCCSGGAIGSRHGGGADGLLRHGLPQRRGAGLVGRRGVWRAPLRCDVPLLVLGTALALERSAAWVAQLPARRRGAGRRGLGDLESHADGGGHRRRAATGSAERVWRHRRPAGDDVAPLAGPSVLLPGEPDLRAAQRHHPGRGRPALADAVPGRSASSVRARRSRRRRRTRRARRMASRRARRQHDVPLGVPRGRRADRARPRRHAAGPGQGPGVHVRERATPDGDPDRQRRRRRTPAAAGRMDGRRDAGASGTLAGRRQPDPPHLRARDTSVGSGRVDGSA